MPPSDPAELDSTDQSDHADQSDHGGGELDSHAWDDAPCGLVRLNQNGLITDANAQFLSSLGYPRAELVGHRLWRDMLSMGSRLLFETQLAPVLQLQGSVREVLLELRDSAGARVPVLMNAARRRDGQVSVAVMTVPDRKAYEDELRRARDDAERAQAADQHTRARLLLLSRANEALASSTDVERALGRLADMLVDGFADWCVIYARDPDDTTGPVISSVACADGDVRPLVEELVPLLPVHAQPGSNIATVTNSDSAVLRTTLTEAELRAATDSDDVVRLCRQLHVGSTIVASGRARRYLVATLVLARRDDHPPFTESDLADVADLATRTGIVIDNLYRQAREHNNSVALQQALLTEPPPTPLLEIATRYLPSAAGNEVGGDWYDVFLQEDGTPVLIIGDVIGHDIHAAAAMGQLRGVIRTLGFTEGAAPAQILARADAAARGLGVATIASALVARIESGEQATTVRWSSAGHPPPLLRTATGDVEILDPTTQVLLGVNPRKPRYDQVKVLGAGDTLVLYTDGLVERVEESIDEGLNRLAATLTACGDLTPDEVCDRILGHNAGDGRDDIALLVARIR